MPRPIWKGHITFGLVSIPVNLQSAERRFELHFKMLDSRDKARIRYERVNEITGEEVPWEQIVKAYDYDDQGNYVVMNEEDFKRAAVEATQTIDIEDFVELQNIDSIYFDKPYYLVPGKGGEKGYALLRETLKKTKKIGIAKVVIRTRQYLAAVKPEDGALVLNILRFHQELIPPKELEKSQGDLKGVKINPKEVQMAEKLVQSMTSRWKPEKYHDEYRDALMHWIEKKAKSGGMVPAAELEASEVKSKGAEVIDIMSLLKKSIQRRGGKVSASEKEKKLASKTSAQRRRH